MKHYFLLVLTLMSSTTFAAFIPSEEEMLTKAKNSIVVIEYLRQEDDKIDESQLKFMKAPNTLQMCTRMAFENNCSMSFRVLDSDGSTLISGAIYYNGRKNKYSIFRIMDGAPASDSDFEGFSRAHQSNEK